MLGAVLALAILANPAPPPPLGVGVGWSLDANGSRLVFPRASSVAPKSRSVVGTLLDVPVPRPSPQMGTARQPADCTDPVANPGCVQGPKPKPRPEYVLAGSDPDETMVMEQVWWGLQTLVQGVTNIASLGSHLADLDGDGDLDMVIAADAAGFLLNDGTGAWFNPGASTPPLASCGNVACPIGDAAGSGTTADIGPQNQYNAPPIRNHCFMDMGDIDADGDLDIILGTYAKVFLNAPGPVFSLAGSQVTLGVYTSQCNSFGDVDGDGDLDIVLGLIDPGAGTNSQLNLQLKTEVWVNDGSAAFTLSGTYMDRVTTAMDFAFMQMLGDLNGDGHVDLFYGDSSLINDGAGGFTKLANVNIGVLPKVAVDLGDIDGDGDLDAMILNVGVGLLFRNHGAANFTRISGSAIEARVGGTNDGVFADFDGDGALRGGAAGGCAPRLWADGCRVAAAAAGCGAAAVR